ncbi:MAG TPA: two-component regulator propeller domain-containing protein, partial [Puia sp.]|nr:two-component regulator propeller domain-containing protein [Puia sp.]
MASAGQTNPPGFSVTNYTSDNALPQNSINAMAFDRNGFLWLATEMGLVRFDGRNFREYNSANSPLLLSNRCAGISLERSSGRIILEPEFSNHHILTVTDNYQLEVDSALSNPWQMNLRDNNQFSFAHLYKKWAAGNTSAFGGLFNGLENNGDFLTVNNSQAYVTKDQRYYFLDEHTAGVRPLSEIAGHAMKVQFIIGDVYILIDKQNHLYAYKDGNRQPVAGSTRLLDLLRQIDVKGAYLMQAKLRALRDTCHTFFAYKGNILLLSLHNGLVDFDTLAANTSITSINCLIYDQRNKILYVGTATSGLYILKKQEFQRFGFTSDNYAINSLYAQVELSDGRLLTSSGILDPRNKINTPTPGIYDRQAIFRSSDDSIWYSSYGYVRKSDTGLHHSSTVQAIGLGSWLASFVETPGGDVLFCSRGFLYRWHRGKTTLLLDRSAWPEDTEIYVLELINPNELWIGTSAGLFSYDLSHATLGFRPELGKATVRAIHKARDGGIWIGTYGQGFYKYTGGRFIRMPADPGNNLATVH